MNTDMIDFTKRVIKKTFMKFGLEVHGYNPNSSHLAQLIFSMKKFEIDLVFDVGANTGQFASNILDGGFMGKVVSFEPLSSAHAKLSMAGVDNANWEIYSRCALGNQDGEASINIAGNSASSSLLQMADSHIMAAPHTAYVGKEMVPLVRLDTISREYLLSYKRPFLKIDAQGFEWQVLEGAAETLPHIQGVLLEMSLIPLYEGSHLWEEMLQRMSRSGFTLWTLQPGFTDSTNGRTLQVDGIFYRTN